MTILEIIQILIFFSLLIGLTPILGKYMANVFTGNRHFMLPVFGWLERLAYRFIKVDPNEETNWKSYAFGLLMFNLTGFLFVFLIQLFQAVLPLNPAHLSNVSWHSAFNTAVSFMTNTNWQGYAGETTLSYFVQMVGLTVQNFVSAATGIAVLLALIKGISRKTTDKLGNFWVDLTRSTLYVLLPLSIVLAVLLVGQGVVQNFNSYETIQTLQGAEQVIPSGPAASQIAIKQMGTNGGGFFNANSAHPFENPTPFSNLLEMLAILLIPASLTFTYGKMVGSTRQGWTIFTAMIILLISGLAISLYAEYASNPVFGHLSLMEGKETRFGITNSLIWSTSTTAASNGSVNAMHDSLSPLSGMIAMINIMLGEVVFGGVGAGLYGMVIFVILTVFIAGLMVGRTPEYMGKKIEAFEVKMAIIAVLAPSFVILIFSAWASVSQMGLSSLNNSGPHGFSEILYAFSSAAGNNGSAFAGLNANTVFYNLTLGIGMLIGRFGVIIPVLAIAGSMGRKKITPLSAGTFRTDNWLFIGLLIGVILIVGGLTFFPALSLGPIVEQLLLNNGITF
ncbi:MAG: potassium-transporting ATPase subunit KdpA [Bacteroidetes bacterium GWF2_42_66]|nr:MAG: potassium-transporting ATPase subunit KdpA [Bacteroidetes bacterium GWA2_42_15]OFY00129.1 MAG: potassium-transporting ATPase subunit KdpA [Bacteroidetes bacterium GWE2_42_39]OFY40271.1 MAG: potassium-transporting ATPase subunit KdpA [Bacteroidetes bacterium GWF2_42_66]HBL73750.1 potassium-transporting ATPase subunit KdpA [Prolixibacteraceae bacterium]HCR88946.1 potassium-transporting ATPase subunit KdpA [Prolixibacteraceae bacterium]